MHKDSKLYFRMMLSDEMVLEKLNSQIRTESDPVLLRMLNSKIVYVNERLSTPPTEILTHIMAFLPSKKHVSVLHIYFFLINILLSLFYSCLKVMTYLPC